MSKRQHCLHIVVLFQLFSLHVMELHSYAKRRAIKKWSIEQKRRLVEARINCDGVFKIKPKTSLLPWKKVISQGKLDDFNAVFVRKQWGNMVAKYMQYKQDRLGNKPTHDIDSETVSKITEEWEFFQPIHWYMTRKTTNLHSYALTTQHQHENGSLSHEEHYPRSPDDLNMKLTPMTQGSTSSNDRLNVCSSDTNEEFAMMASNTLPNTDHDFYSKRADQQSYFADVEEDTLESITMDVATTTETVVNGADIQHTQEFIINGTQVYETKTNVPNIGNQETVQTAIKQEPLESNEQTVAASKGSSSNSLSNERDKYYSHKRRFNHRMERRFDAMLNIIGQIAKAEYPSIDISPIENVSRSCFLNGFLSNTDDDTTDDDANGNKLN